MDGVLFMMNLFNSQDIIKRANEKQFKRANLENLIEFESVLKNLHTRELINLYNATFALLAKCIKKLTKVNPKVSEDFRCESFAGGDMVVGLWIKGLSTWLEESDAVFGYVYQRVDYSDYSEAFSTECKKIGVTYNADRFFRLGRENLISFLMHVKAKLDQQNQIYGALRSEFNKLFEYALRVKFKNKKLMVHKEYLENDIPKVEKPVPRMTHRMRWDYYRM
jgi:hypothetical protein